MFEFMRRKKEILGQNKDGRTEAETEKPKNKGLLRRGSFIPTVKADGSSAKRARYFSGPPKPPDDLSDRLTERPPTLRTRSSSCSAVSSLDIRNPFQQYTEDSAMTASQVALTESMSSLVGPSRESVRYVVSHAPVLVSPQAERAEIFYSDDVLETPNASSLSISPFADAIPPVGVTDAAERAVGCEDSGSTKNVSPTISRSASRKSCHTPTKRPLDYLHVKIPAGMMSPPMSEPHKAIWARI